MYSLSYRLIELYLANKKQMLIDLVIVIETVKKYD